ncbi:MAG: hypothetical protein ACK44M_00790, partial [Chloroflexus sp.]
MWLSTLAIASRNGITALHTLPEGRATPPSKDTDAMTAWSQGQSAFRTLRQAAVRATNVSKRFGLAKRTSTSI